MTNLDEHWKHVFQPDLSKNRAELAVCCHHLYLPFFNCSKEWGRYFSSRSDLRSKDSLITEYFSPKP